MAVFQPKDLRILSTATRIPVHPGQQATGVKYLTYCCRLSDDRVYVDCATYFSVLKLAEGGHKLGL